jgi:hypothetical protein
LCLRYLDSMSFAIYTGLARFPVDPHERLTVVRSLLAPMFMLRRAVKFGDAKKSSVKEDRANEKRNRESARASKCL